MNFKNYATQLFQKKGFRITKHKLAVIEILSKSNNGLNAYDVAAKIRKQKIKIDTSTVYRILEAYKKIGLVHFIKEQNGYLSCKEFSCKEEQHCHHQFVCKKCNKVEEIHLNDSEFIKTVSAKLPKLNIQNHYFEFLGQCSSCTNSTK